MPYRTPGAGCALALTATLVAAAPAAAQDPTSCRASAARATVPGPALSEPLVANRDGAPCRTETAPLADVMTVGPLAITEPRAATRRQPGLVAASSGVGGATLTLGGVAIRVGVVEAGATATCVDGASRTGGGSRVDELVVGGTTVPIVADRPVDLALGAVRVRANVTDGATRRALVLDAGGTQVVLGEATAGGDACAPPPGGDPGGSSSGGTQPGGGASGGDGGARVCPSGSTYDAAGGVCVIRTATGGGRSTSTLVGTPGDSPVGGRVVTLTEARRLAAAGRIPRSPCLSGPGLRYVVLGTAGPDRITGTNRSDRVIALGGADRVDGGRSGDCLDGGSGRDVLSGGLGPDRLYGGTGSDAVNGGSATDLLSGGTGDDTINTGFGRDRVSAGPGRDAVNAATAGPASVRIDCGPGRDRLRANRNERRRLRGCERRSFLP